MNYLTFINGDRGIFVLKKLIKLKKYNPQGIIYCKKNLKKKLNVFSKKINKIYLEDINSLKSEKILKGLKTDIFLIAGYPQILKKKIFSIPKVVAVNLHGGPLPSYRGGSPLNWQIINGKKNIGVSLVKINSKIDGGKIIDTKFFRLKPFQDIKIAHKKANKLFFIMVKNFFNNLQKTKKILYKKKLGSSKYWRQRTDKDGELDFNNKNSYECLNFIRAISFPYPGAWISFKTRKSKFLRFFSAKPTNIISKKKNIIIKKKYLLIPTKDKMIKITKFKFI